MGKLVFFYTNHGSTPEPLKKWPKDEKSHNPYVKILPTEGYYYLLKELKDRGIVEDVLFIIESNRSPGYFEHDGMQGYTVPHIRNSREFINKGDILWARGGFRSWHDYMIELQKEGFWLMLYAANTGRERWTFWDIILEDLNETEIFDKRERLWVYFKKPMNESIFKYMQKRKRYDLCIGASHIHDRKCQYKILEALSELRKDTGKKLNCIMPGSSRGGTHTRKWLNEKALNPIGVELPGMLPRVDLARVFNESKVFCYLGAGGQGDRGPLEAMACGTNLFIGATRRLAPAVYNNPDVTHICTDPDNSKVIYRELLQYLDDIDKRKNVGNVCVNHYLQENGIEVAVNFMQELIEFIQNNPKQDKGVLKKYAQSRKATIA